MFDKILVALDLKDSYEALFTQARSLAEKTKAKLVLLQVLDAEGDYVAPFPYYATTTGYPIALDETLWGRYQAEYKARKEAGRTTLTKLVEIAADAGVEAEFVQSEGDAGKAICKCAQLQKADLVIVGSHGRRGIQEFLIGSVSSYVMHRAPCAVMISKEQDSHVEAIEGNHNIESVTAA